MKNRITILILLIVIIIFVAIGAFLGLKYQNSRNNLNPSEKKIETFNLTLDEIYSNIKDSKRIMKVKITIETSSKSTLELLTEKQFLIRDDVNKIIRNKTEDEIQGKEGHLSLQNEIRDSLVKLFKDTTIINIYFNDLIIQ